MADAQDTPAADESVDAAPALITAVGRGVDGEHGPLC